MNNRKNSGNNALWRPQRIALQKPRLERREAGPSAWNCLSFCSFLFTHLRFKERIYEVNLQGAITVLLTGECNEGEN